MDEKLKALIDDYITSFLNQEHVKHYFALEKQINESQDIASLQERLKRCQKDLALALNDDKKHETLKQEYLSLKAEFDNNPLVNNYNVLKEEIYQELTDLSSKLKTKKE